MCDLCAEVLNLLSTYDPDVNWGPKRRLKKSEIGAICTYVQAWSLRQCLCIYKEPRNYDRFNHLIQGVLWAALELLRDMEIGVPPSPTIFLRAAEDNQGDDSKRSRAKSPANVDSSRRSESQEDGGGGGHSISDASMIPPSNDSKETCAEEIMDWTLEEKEHLLQFVTKTFLLNFPHYTAYRHNIHAKLEDISQQEATVLSVHCDTNDPEIPVHLLRNVCFFCDYDGLLAIAACFIDAAPDTLPFCLARAMISIVSNLKLWLNVAAVVKYLVPLRTAVIRYMCKLSDKDLRAAGTRSMSEFMWTAVKDPLDSHLSFDKEGLDLAFKYFTSSTLTMRLAGLAHINNHVTMYSELCNGDAVVETEALGLGLADWLITNRIIENIFGPNLHVEIIKQSHIVLNFLAMEGCITHEHVDSMWAAAQLKHCSKQVHDLLLPLIKHLKPRPVVHLYYLLCQLEPCDHTEQTLYLASALLKVIWSNGNSHHPQLALACEQGHLHRRPSPFSAVFKGAVSELAQSIEPKDAQHDSSTEHSVSMDSDDDTQASGLVQHLVKRGKKLYYNEDGRPLDPGSSVPMASSILLREWANETASFSSSENDSDAMNSDGHVRRRSGGGSKDRTRVLVTLPSSDSDEPEAGEEEEEGCDDSGSSDDEGDCMLVPCRRQRVSRGGGRSSNSRRVSVRRRWRKQDARRRKIGGSDGPTTRGSDDDERRKKKKKKKQQPPPPQQQQQRGDSGIDHEASSSESESPSSKKAREESKSERKTSKSAEKERRSRAVATAEEEDDDEDDEEEEEEEEEEGDASEDRVASQLSEGDGSSLPQLDENVKAKVYECMQYLEHQMQPQRLSHGEIMEDIMSPDDASCSSRMSTKSDKNMADFDGEESGCDAELIQLTSHAQVGHLGTASSAPPPSPQQQQQQVREHLANMASLCCAHLHRQGVQRGFHQRGDALGIPRFDLEAVCQPGQTLLWDLLQDDTVVKLGKGLALEAEKVLSNLVCWSTDRTIRMKFIEGCLQNLANNRSIYLSLRLLPRLFGSFQQYRGRMDTHTITMWAEKEHKMMEHFFNNLVNYTKLHRKGSAQSLLYSHQVEIQVRLQFLTCIFSTAGSPDYFRLGLEQVDTLWWCLSSDTETMDELFSWLLTQAKNKEQHALGMDTLYHIYTEKLPLLQPETISMTGLNLLQQLGNIIRQLDESSIELCRDSAPRGMDQLWGIALRAQSTDVSMAAIQYLNNYYINGHPQNLEREEEFIQRCMTSLASVLPLLCEESSLVVVQRALLLLKTHLETFHCRYAFHLRTWHLEGRGIIGHQRPQIDRQVTPLRVICQPAGITEKIVLELLSTDYVADLRAEVTYWWEQFQQRHQAARNRQQDSDLLTDGSSSSSSSTSSTSSSSSSSGGGGVVVDGAGAAGSSSGNVQEGASRTIQSPPSVLSPILGAMLTNGPIRVITQGQELTTDLDERTLGELGFKDMQLVFVSIGAPRPHRKREELEPASVLPPPPREKLPASLLLQASYFEQLFKLIQQLGELKTPGRRGNLVPHTKAQLLSWRVWEILMMIPTCPEALSSLRSLGNADDEESAGGGSTKHQEVLNALLDPRASHKLMYSLQIVESLVCSDWIKQRGGGGFPQQQNAKANAKEAPAANSATKNVVSWVKQFVEKGGLRHLFDIFMSGILQAQDKDVWSEWNQDCLAYLLKLIYQLGLDGQNVVVGKLPAVGGDSVSSSSNVAAAAAGPLTPTTTTKRKSKKQKRCPSEQLSLPKLNNVMLVMLSDVSAVTRRVVSILYDAGRLHDTSCFKLGVGGRGQVVHFTLALLLSWVLSCDEVVSVLFGDSYMTDWLRHLLLDDPEPSVRQEVCSSLYRLCLGTSSDGRMFILPLLSCLLGFLQYARNMKPTRMELLPEGEKDKEPYGPACRDYFWLVCRLVDSLSEDTVKEASQGEYKTLLDLDGMVRQLAEAILSRDFLETRHNIVEDDGLVGLFNLCTVVLKHNPPFKFSKEGQDFLVRVFDCLFALPSPKQRHLPLCKSQMSRSAAYDLIVEMTKGCFDNYFVLHQRLLQQHSPNSHSPYPWDYWPHEDGRSDCGYVGLTNLGATCYMASCMQHLYMMPQARASILSAKCSLEGKHESMLKELQRMFAYLLESERKAYNPRSFCKVYTMDHQPLNTGEQKDMAEFFTDLISKLEEMTPQLKELVKTLFQGVITNNVVSLDCSHVSRTIEEFYTVRCQVADMRNLYESLDEVTVKDTLEGDNMYTCSQCGRKVRAEKRACFKKLPRILCFNTMRYTFNMVTMMKEKVNTHFSFPLRLDMSKYTEKHLMPDHHKAEGDSKESDVPGGGDEYDLIGVTVHTGTADGGHYYSFIRDRTTSNKDKWLLFNDAEVKPFDSAQLAAECFGGEMTSKTYDSVTDKFMDFSFEKTNSAYMLFYERVSCGGQSSVLALAKEEIVASWKVPMCMATLTTTTTTTTAAASILSVPFSGVVMMQHQHQQPEHSSTGQTIELPRDLADWIWEDNMQFLQDKNIFEHAYFHFMWQVCGFVPQTLMQHKDVTLLAAKLSTSFVLETLIHAKEKPTMVQWIELLTKLFNSSPGACEWFLNHMADHDWWPVQILIRCPNQVVRQMFQRLCIHVINKLRPMVPQKIIPISDDERDAGNASEMVLGSFPTCVTRFIKKLLSLIEHGANQHTKHLTEYFAFLLEFAKMSSLECQFLLSIETIYTVVNFYLGHKAGDYVDPVSDEDEEDVDDVLSLADDKYKPVSLEKMVSLIAMLVEKSRGDDHHLHLSASDFNAIAGGKGFPFLCQQIRDNINIRQTCNLIFSLCRWNEPLAIHIVGVIFQAIGQHPEQSQPFFKLLSMLVEFVGGPPGMPAFTKLVLQRIWDVAEACPQQCLEWLSIQVPRNKHAHSWVLQRMESWVELFLIAHSNQRVRNAAAFLLVSLIPSSHFKQAFRTARNMLSPQKEIPMSQDAVTILHHIYDLLLRLLKRAKHYLDTAIHGTTKLTSYFALMTYCLVSHAEKLMFGQYFLDLWQLFQPKLSEPPIAVHHNKQALLTFWYQVCVDCPENIKLIVQNAHVTKNIAFNYILADHEDQEVMIFNRYMLPAYYGLLRLCCQQSRPFTRQLASHQNIQWAFKNITPYPAQYSVAVDELYKLMRLFIMKYPDSSEQELKEISAFKCTSLQLYLSVLDGRSCWATLIAVLRILVETNDDRIFLVYNNGIPVLFEAFHTLHVMYHEATACHVTNDLTELLAIVLDTLKCARAFKDGKLVKQCLCNWKERSDAMRKLITLLNSYAPPALRQSCIDVLRELVLLYSLDCLQCLVPIMTHSHSGCQENAVPVPCGPYFPRRGQKPVGPKTVSRPPHPVLQMTLHPNQLDAPKGVDPEYDQAVFDYFMPYHQLLDIMCRVAVNHDLLSEALVNLSATIGIEGISQHFVLFPKLWLDIYQAEHVDKKYVDMLCSSFFFVDYVERSLVTERGCLTNPIIFQFLFHYMPKISCRLTNERMRNLVECLTLSLENAIKMGNVESEACRLNGDLLALKLLCPVDSLLVQQRSHLTNELDKLVAICRKVSPPPSKCDSDDVSSAAKRASEEPCTSSSDVVGSTTAEAEVKGPDSSTADDAAVPCKRPKWNEEPANAKGAEEDNDAVPSSSTTTTSSNRPVSDDGQPSSEVQGGCGGGPEAEKTPQQTLPDWMDILMKTATSLRSVLWPPPSSTK